MCAANTVPGQLALRTPCCSRTVRPAPFYLHATYVAQRTCPGCRARWQVTLRPRGQAAPGAYVHLADWALLAEPPQRFAGERERRRNPETGHEVTLYNAAEAHLCTEGGPWATVCEAHSTVCNHSTRKLASWHMADPAGWCAACSAELGD